MVVLLTWLQKQGVPKLLGLLLTTSRCPGLCGEVFPTNDGANGPHVG